MAKEHQPGIWLLEAFHRGGIDTDVLAARCPTAVPRLLAAPAELTLDDLNELLVCCADISNDESFGLRLIDLVETSMLGTYGYLLANAPTVRRFLEIGERYYPTLYRGAALEFQAYEATATLVFRPRGPSRFSMRHDNEWTLGFFVDHIRKRLPFPWYPQRVTFANEPPRDTAELERILGPNLEFEQQRTAFEFATSLLDQAISPANSLLLQILTDQAETLLLEIDHPTSLDAIVRLHILEGLEDGTANLENVARRLALSRSTLKRRLAARGTSFRRLRDDVVHRVAARALTDTAASIGSIASKLGYSELSAFDRAFRRLSGRTPTGMRAAAVTAPPPPPSA